MALDSFDGLLRELREHPEWQAQLRRLVLTDQLLELPGALATLTRAVEALAGGQQRTEERLSTLVERVDSLVQAQQRTEERLAALAEQVAEQLGRLAAAQEQTEVRLQGLAGRMDEVAGQLGRLAAAQEQTEVRLQGLAEQWSTVSLRADRAIGYLVEQEYRSKAHAYFQTIARRLRLLDIDDLEDLLERGLAGGAISQREAAEVRWADAVLRGRRDGEPILLVVEASFMVDRSDVERAAERARILSAAGATALPVAAGDKILPDAFQAARDHGVWLVTDGHVEEPAAA